MFGKSMIAAAGLSLYLPAMTCGMPGVSLDTSKLGDTPLGEQIGLMMGFDDEYASKFSTEWFVEECPFDEIRATVDCARGLGMDCGESVVADGATTLCSYRSEYRARSVRFSISPSIDGRPNSPWITTDVSVRLEQSSDGKVSVVFERKSDAASCEEMPEHPNCG